MCVEGGLKMERIRGREESESFREEIYSKALEQKGVFKRKIQ
jgi:hypothetical protein